MNYLPDSTPHPLLSKHLEYEKSPIRWTLDDSYLLKDVYEEKVNYLCEGVANLDGELHLTEANVKCGTLQNPNIEALVQYSYLSSSPTVISVPSNEKRNLRSLTKNQSSRLKKRETEISSKELNYELGYQPEIMKNLQKLFPNSNNISLVFSKMIIYEPAGLFDHQESVRTDQSIQGILLLEVKSHHQGGSLLLSYYGYEHCWSTENPDPQVTTRRDIPPIRYIAYKVKDIHATTHPVLEGTKIVLRYEIHVHDENDGNPSTMLATSPTSSSTPKVWELSSAKYYPSPVTLIFTRKLATHLQNLLPHEGVAIPMFHIYTDAQPTPSRLKTNDLQLFNFLIHHGYCVQLMPIVLHESPYGRGAQRYSIHGIPTLEIGYVLEKTRGGDGGYIPPLLEAHNILMYPSKIRYVATGYEQVKLIEQIDHGIFDEELESSYYTTVFVVSLWKKSRE